VHNALINTSASCVAGSVIHKVLCEGDLTKVLMNEGKVNLGEDILLPH